MKSCVNFNSYLFGKYKINTIFAYINLKTDKNGKLKDFKSYVTFG